MRETILILGGIGFLAIIITAIIFLIVYLLDLKPGDLP